MIPIKTRLVNFVYGEIWTDLYVAVLRFTWYFERKLTGVKIDIV